MILLPLYIIGDKRYSTDYFLDTGSVPVQIQEKQPCSKPDQRRAIATAEAIASVKLLKNIFSVSQQRRNYPVFTSPCYNSSYLNIPDPLRFYNINSKFTIFGIKAGKYSWINGFLYLSKFSLR